MTNPVGINIVMCLIVVIQDASSPKLAPSPVPIPMDADSAQPRINFDRRCAATSLYVLLRLAGESADYERILQRFEADPDSASPTPAEGYCKAARDFGVELDLVRLRESDLRRLKGPFIIYQHPCAGVETGVGHYLAARVVDGGRQVQFVDPPNEPVLFKRADLFRPESKWQRIALVPRSSYDPTTGIISLVAGILALITGTGLILKIRTVHRLQDRCSHS